MRITVLMAFAMLCLSLSNTSHSLDEPFEGGQFKGRIALSHDGNYNDEDDWGAFPVVIAMLDAFGVKDKVVHVDFNNITNYNDPHFESEMTTSVLGAAQRYGIPESVLHNCGTDLDGAIRSITDAVNASSAENPLWYLLAGPMDVPYRGIAAADPSKRQYVYCLSHSVWNDGYGRKRRIEGCTKRDVIALGIKWIQVRPGNLLQYPGASRAKSTPQQWALFQWMRDSSDERVKWIYTRLQAIGRADVSDSTILYSLMTGDEQCDPRKLAALLDKKQKPNRMTIRPTIRLEAENFDLLEGSTTVLVGKKVSQSLAVRMSGAPKGTIRTKFHEIYAPQTGRYNVDIQYHDETNGAATFALLINGVQQGDKWKASANDPWKTQTIKNVPIAKGDEIVVQVTSDDGARGELDYIELNYQGEQ